MRRTIIILVTVLAVVGTACQAASTENATTTLPQAPRGPTGVQAFAASALQPFDSCNEFLDYVKKHASAYLLWLRDSCIGSMPRGHRK